ncbi:ABC transporter ATP-binding protein [Capnocytophaga sp. oral taxon 878]|uniref:ABC transporter ATP-binding protein n=1 Tax=Capnocytophaga sp. oral taxon 878 TaxID=1316596 RepID=UPI000D028091|nr:ABC transporter ATP-binding protein [Capnocytophaga sp. oral taxon 878]AVM50741.1 ABC transporter ATP-binding protein [Capnocytophaga sp. oral taxon 878]
MLEVNNITFAYDKAPIVRNISFELPQGELLSLMGESGCGKSTLLKAIYGLIDLKEGEVRFHNQRVWGPAHQLVPGHSTMKYLAQDFGLGPYHTVAENVGKFISNLDLDYKKERVTQLLTLVGMERFAPIKALNLSGGEKQRVALAMSLAQEPKLLLLDEPFSQVDNFRKNDLQRTLFAYLKEQNISCVVATHDGRDALSFSDKTLIMRDGELLHFGDTLTIYAQNTDFYTASLFGEVSWYKDKLFKPQQITIAPERTDWQAVVQHCYYQGAYYLIEAIAADNNKTFFYHTSSIEKGTKVALQARE